MSPPLLPTQVRGHMAHLHDRHADADSHTYGDSDADVHARPLAVMSPPLHHTRLWGGSLAGGAAASCRAGS